MTAAKRKASDKAEDADRQLNIEVEPGKSQARKLAEVALDPNAHAMATANLFGKGTFGPQPITDSYEVIQSHAKAAISGDLANQKAMLAGQATALNAIFSEMARRAALNMGEYVGATESYMRLALKAQAQCRSTIEALDRLTSGHVQTVKHVHVNEGGQAVVTDHFHHHAGGQQNGQTADQPHATGTSQSGTGPALSCPDPIGPAVPFPGSEGQSAMQDARGARKRRA